MKFTLLSALTTAAATDAPEWKVIHKAFSAVTIGIGFQDDKIGWTTSTDVASLPGVVNPTPAPTPPPGDDSSTTGSTTSGTTTTTHPPWITTTSDNDLGQRIATTSDNPSNVDYHRLDPRITTTSDNDHQWHDDHHGSTTTTTTTTTHPMWACQSSQKLENPAKLAQKGFAVDDTTMLGCVDEIGLWPHSDQPIGSLRLFAAWKPEWDESTREAAWDKLFDVVQNSKAQILMGVSAGEGRNAITDADHKSLDWAILLIKKMGKDRIMGVGIGNEMDDNKYHYPADFWSPDGAYVTWVKKVAKALDDAGFEDVPLTTAWTAGIITKIDDEFRPMLQALHDEFKSRWVWAFNPYSIWTSDLWPTSQKDCQAKTDIAIGVEFFKSSSVLYRDKVAKIVGSNDYKLWLTEAGWSSPAVSSQQRFTSFCPQWASLDTLFKFYHGLMAWDLTLGGDHDVDHLFMFTMRDVPRMNERFGMIANCGDKACKVGSSNLVVV